MAPPLLIWITLTVSLIFIDCCLHLTSIQMTGIHSALWALNMNVEHTQAKDNDPTICPACHKRLKTAQGLATHLSTANGCQWYKKGKLRALMLPGEFAVDEDVLMREVNSPLPEELEGRMEEEEPGQVI